MNVMGWPILLESTEGRRRYQIIAVPPLYIGVIWCAAYIGVIAVAQFLVEYFKARFFHGFLANNEWRDIVKGLLYVIAGTIWREKKSG